MAETSRNQRARRADETENKRRLVTLLREREALDERCSDAMIAWSEHARDPKRTCSCPGAPFGGIPCEKLAKDVLVLLVEVARAAEKS